MLTLTNLYKIICQRRDNPPAPDPSARPSYTASLFAKGEDEIVKKVGEEAVEVILAAKSQDNQRLVEEVADLTYHMLVLLAAHHLLPADIQAELDRRHH